MNPFRPPVRRTRRGYAVRLGEAETAVMRRMLGELRELLVSEDPAAAALTRRLFPPAVPDDPALDAEYQRLMREELVQSRVSAIDAVEQMLTDQDAPLDEARLHAFMTSINSVRLVLGTMLDVSDDPTTDEVRADVADSPEHHLYGYLSWLLEHTVRALTGG